MNTTPTTPAYACSASELAQIHGLTPRRVRQYAEDGELPRLARGSFDIAWFLYLRIGEQITRSLSNRPEPAVLVALGWLSAGVDNRPPSDDDLAAFGGVFVRNGISRDRALLALGEAQALMRRR